MSIEGMDEFRECNDVQYRSKYKHQRTIIHIDLDCFYAQVEMLKNPELYTKPIGIKQQHYVITSNYVAREYGIKKCMLITDALALCPKLIIINGEDLHDYRLMSSKVCDVIRQFSNKVEKLGLDENFVDLSDLIASTLETKDNTNNTVVGHIYMNIVEDSCTCGCRERLILGSHIAFKIRERIKEELGMTCCAGIGHNKLLAKLVCSTHKPNQQTTIFPCLATTLLSNLNSIRAIPGVGRRTRDILQALGITSIEDAQHSSIKVLGKHLGETQAFWIKGACFGVDDTDVKESGKQQVIGLEEASKKICSVQDVYNRLNSLIERGMVLLKEDGRYPTTVRVTLRKYSKDEYSRQRESKQCSINPSVLKTSTAKEEIFEIALGLFKKLVDHSKPFHLTLIGLAFTKFQEELPPKSSLLKFLNIESDRKCEKSSTVADNNDTKDCDNKEDLNKLSHVLDIDLCNDKRTAEKTMPYGDLDESVLSELPHDIRSEILQNYPQNVNKSIPSSSSSHNSQCCVRCPSGMDSEVFNELPYEIQEELLKDFNKTNTNKKIVKRSTDSKKQNSILNYFKK